MVFYSAKKTMFQLLLQHHDKKGAPFSIVQTHTMLQLCFHHENRKSMVLYSSNRDHTPAVVMKL